MVRKVLAHGKLLLTVSAEILFQWTNIVAWQQMPTFWGIAANLQETLIGVFVCFFICLLVCFWSLPPFSESAGMEGGG